MRTFHPIVAVATLMRRLVCVIWHYRAEEGLDSSSFFFQTLKIHCFNLINVCTYCSELIVAPLSKNCTNKIPSLPQKT